MLDSEVTFETLQDQNFPVIVAVSYSGSIIEVLQMNNPSGLPNLNYLVVSEIDGWSTDDIMTFLDVCREMGYVSLVDSSIDIHNFIRDEE